MSRKPRSKDYDIRAAVIERLLADGVERRDIRHEITLDTSSSNGRLDLLILHRDRLLSLEIKSGSDKLDRLREQLRRAKRATDFALVVSDVRHREKSELPHYSTTYWHPETCGFVSMSYYAKGWIDVTPRFTAITALADKQSGHTSVPDVARMLWRSEAVEVARRLAGATCPQRTRTDAIDWIKENASLRELRPLVCDQIRGRVASRWDDAFWARFDAENPAGGE